MLPFQDEVVVGELNSPRCGGLAYFAFSGRRKSRGRQSLAERLHRR
ncbi:MAG: hypothetical protein LBU34_04245 [Planctomycetaceae bacterium]|nr:hypothetical protein [Planctomycetaceae bacterium]